MGYWGQWWFLRSVLSLTASSPRTSPRGHSSGTLPSLGAWHFYVGPCSLYSLVVILGSRVSWRCFMPSSLHQGPPQLDSHLQTTLFTGIKFWSCRFPVTRLKPRETEVQSMCPLPGLGPPVTLCLVPASRALEWGLSFHLPCAMGCHGHHPSNRVTSGFYKAKKTSMESPPY